MLEHLLCMGGGDVDYGPFPLVGDFELDGMCVVGDAGPGPQCLIGYTPEDDKGFFGEVLGSELITMRDLTERLEVTVTNVQFRDESWLKFWLDGRILYVAKKHIQGTVSWNHLNGLGLIDGSKVITLEDSLFRVGLMSGINPGYTGTVSYGSNQPYTMRSEWTRLMYNVASDTGIATERQKQGQVGDNWAEYPQDNSANGLHTRDGNGYYNWTRDLNPGNLSQAVARGDASVAYMSAIHTTSGRCWRPMLELIKE